MKKFEFSLQSILDLQYQLEEQQKQNFREATDKLHREEELLKQLINQMTGYQDEMKANMEGNIDLKKIKELKHSIDIMKSRVRTQMLRVHVEEKNVEAARIKLQEAMISRKTYEKMREKAFDEYKLLVQAEENKEIDQLVSFTHGKR